ncbi:amino acid/amide ABC transporter substrate-binding protein, HAAT family [Gemmobacter megaterium]|uniref:Amino acid/amide ABC transporter substrate-binding protein, HAAT family n=1 Tax=Gemmobacter megaterium TaxID=1086013 RepID=A0A1N7K9H3_9RHOB|nr:ABC transporter substrate-binding protein [Gemmobacter megaterium]GGE00980.1 ABC transporter permease [Gemmobacter megaterium]SIS58225.1 amino acid/amide ABC transporter substrate-binding protein, HAAT family [Gemmobacter megaterium]
MSLTRRNILTGAAVAALASQLPVRVAFAQDKTIRFSLPMDFTRVYTFVTSEYSQGQRDYISLINGRGGIGGYTIVPDVSDHANDQPRAIEAYERGKSQGAVLIDPLSTPVARALVPRVLADKINMVTAFSGRSDAADGTAFPYVFPLSPNYWTQSGLLIDFFKQQDGGSLQGKTIAFVHIDTPFGKEPLPILEKLAEKEGYKLVAFPYTPPGNDQSAIWPQVRRARPDWVMFWGAGVGQTVALTEAARNGLDMSRVSGSVWVSESDMDVVGRDQTVGVLKVEPCASGRDPKIIQDILSEVVGTGKGAGPEDKVGTAYYNYGVMITALMLEGVRRAVEIAPDGPVSGEWLNAGLNSITDYTAEGLIPSTTITPEDHQGGGMARIARWTGERFEPVTDWFSANQDVVWEEVRKYSEEFKKTGN